MTHDELKELIDLVAEKKFAEFQVERADFRLRIVATHPVAALALHAQASAPQAAVQSASAAFSSAPAPLTPTPAAAADPAPTTASEPAPVVEEAALHIVTSPIVGTFYRASNPTAEPFVTVGSHVDTGTVLCIIEAMKLMNEIEADAAGEVVKIFVENGQPVEYGQQLFALKTD